MGAICRVFPLLDAIHPGTVFFSRPMWTTLTAVTVFSAPFLWYAGLTLSTRLMEEIMFTFFFSRPIKRLELSSAKIQCISSGRIGLSNVIPFYKKRFSQVSFLSRPTKLHYLPQYWTNQCPRHRRGTHVFVHCRILEMIIDN